MQLAPQALALRLGDWIARRAGPEAGEILLNSRRVYILPTRAGLVFAGAMLALLVGAINYGLQLGFLLTFFVVSIAFVAMHATHANLAGLRLRAAGAEPVFCGEPAAFRLLLASDSPRARRALLLGARGAGAATAGPLASADVPARSQLEVGIAVPTARRGALAAPRVLIATRYPLGLWRAWASVQPAQSVLVWPRPEEDAPPLPAQAAGALDGGSAGPSGEHFAGVRPYQDGDPRKAIAWRLAARSDTLSVKLFDQSRGGELLLDYAALPAALDPEARLARLARWVLDAHAAGLRYGLELPGTRLAPAEGEAHRRACLDALALARV
jgi:uncharacterized protein (DUF58 family)